MKIPTMEDIRIAEERIRPFVNKTLVLRSRTINELVGAEVFFKCENFQRVGAFKFRGACNAVLSLHDEQLEHGVATHSSGNHAQALALAARLHGLQATLVMPRNSARVKVDAVRAYGGNIVFCEPNLTSRESTLEQVVKETGAEFIHPYNDTRVVSGQATAALEFIEEVGDLDYMIAPVGGGGLLSGTSIVVNSLLPQCKVLGAEPVGADDAARSIAENKIIPSINPQTIADGLLTSLGKLTFNIIKKNVYKIITVSDETIIDAMRLIFERLKIVVEPSSSIALGVLLEGKYNLKNSRIGIILSGGNVDLDNLPWIKHRNIL